MGLRSWCGLTLTMDDTRRKFEESYVFGSLAGERGEHTLHIGRINDDTGMVRVRVLVSGTDTPELFEVAEKEIDVTHYFPQVYGVIPFFNSILFTRRLPARQWKSALCNANTVMWDASGGTQPLDLAHARACYEAQYPHAKLRGDEIMRLAATALAKQTAIAIDNRYWLKRAGPGVWSLNRNQITLGSFLEDGFFVNKACLSLAQEMKDDLQLEF